MGQRLEPSEEKLEASLQGQQSSQHHHHHHSAAGDMPPQNAKTLDGATSCVYLDNDEGEEGEWTISVANPGGEIHGLDAKLVDADIGEVLNSFINAQDDEIQPHDHPNTSQEREYEEVNSSEECDEEEEIIELEFERAIKKLDTHTMHCPKCNTQVTKVILRRKRKIVRNEHKPLSLLGCLPCLSVFIPSGNYFTMFGIFGDEKNPQQSSPVNVVIQEKGDCFGLFWIFLNKLNSQRIENSPQTSAVDVKHDFPVDPTHVSDKRVIEQEGDQGQNSKGQDVAKRRNSAYYAYAWLHQHGKRFGDRNSPQGIRQPENVTLDVREDSDENTLKEKLLSKNDIEIEERQNAAESRLEEGYYISQDGEGPLVDQQITNPPHKKTRDSSNDRDYNAIEIVKSIVYGGLMESITSLSIVASAAASDATTLSTIALGMANVFGGLFIISRNLLYLKSETSNEQANKDYQELLGRRENFSLQATFAILSFLLFGFIPPVTYGFSFRISNDKDMKIVAVAAAALLGVVLLAIGKAYVQNKPELLVYIKTILYYVALAFLVSGVSFVAGHLIKKFGDELGLFDSNLPASVMSSVNHVLASY